MNFIYLGRRDYASGTITHMIVTTPEADIEFALSKSNYERIEDDVAVEWLVAHDLVATNKPESEQDAPAEPEPASESPAPAEEEAAEEAESEEEKPKSRRGRRG